MKTILETKAGTYEWCDQWVRMPDTPLAREDGRVHGIVISRDGTIYFFHHGIPSVVAYDAAGRVLRNWGNYPGAHSLTLVEEQGTEFFWLTDEQTFAVEKPRSTARSCSRSPSLPIPPTPKPGTIPPGWR